MIAKNYRRFPEALLRQLELALDGIESTFDHIRKTNRALWLVWSSVMATAKDDDRGKRLAPAWWTQFVHRHRALARTLRATQLSFAEGYLA